MFLKRNDEVISQRVKEETVLFDMASGEYFSLNEIGARAWESLDGTTSLIAIAGNLASEYDAPPELILEDIRALSDKLVQAGLLIAIGDKDSASQ